MILSLILSFLVGFAPASEFSGLSTPQEVAIDLPRCWLLQVEPSDFHDLGPSRFMLRVPKEVGVVVPHYTGCDQVSVYKLDHGRAVRIVAQFNIGTKEKPIWTFKSVVEADRYGDKYYVGNMDGQAAITVTGEHYDNAGLPPVIVGEHAVLAKADKLTTTCYSATTNPSSRSISFISCR